MWTFDTFYNSDVFMSLFITTYFHGNSYILDVCRNGDRRSVASAGNPAPIFVTTLCMGSKSEGVGVGRGLGCYVFYSGCRMGALIRYCFVLDHPSLMFVGRVMVRCGP